MAVDWEEPLVPAARSLRRTCTCGRPACAPTSPRSPTSLADRIDREPSLLLRWRGCVERDEPEPPAEPEPIVAGDEIWEAPPPPELGPPRPLPTAAVLKRLGPSGIRSARTTSPRCSSAPTPRSPPAAVSGRIRRGRIRATNLRGSSASIGTTSSARTCVAPSTTGGATPASCASSQRDAQTHQRSPGCRPSKPHSGRGVERSFPTPG